MNNDDTISRAALLETMKSAIDDAPLYIRATVDQMITEAPSVPPQVVHGRWIKKHDNVRYWYECSECGRKPPYSEFYQEDHSRYCPNCGARMDLPEATT